MTPPGKTDERVKRRKFLQVRRQFAQEEQDRQLAQEMQMRKQTGHGSEEEHGEKVKARVHLTPGQPTAKEVEQHRDEQHTNFRSWCAD